MEVWQTQEAKQRFSVLLDKALTEGPQYISRHERTVAVLVSLDQFQRESSQGLSLVEFLRRLDLDGLDLCRQQGQSRPPIDLVQP